MPLIERQKMVDEKEKMSLSYNLVELNLQGKNKFYAFCGPLAKSHNGFYPL